MHRRRLLSLVLLAAAVPLAAAASDGGEKKKRSGGTSFLVVDTLVGTTNKGGGRRGVLTVECGIDAPDPALRQRVEASMPRLRAAYAQTVMTYAAGLPDGAPPNADFIGNALQRNTDAVLGRPGARLLLGPILVN
jgi:hypothetical protein